MRFGLGVAFLVAFFGPVDAQEVVTPERGSALRADLMDALRPHAEWALGAPVQFIVEDLRVAGELAFGALQPARADGQLVTLDTAPIILRDGEDPVFFDGTIMHALFARSGRQWVAVHHSIGATDVWWSSPALCAHWQPVIADYCF